MGVLQPSPRELPANPMLRYLAILSAVRDFGVSRSDIEDIARRFDPLTVRPRELADALADTIRERREASAYAVEDGRMF